MPWCSAFTALIALATGLLFGLAPALQASRTDLQQGLREGGRGRAASGRQTRLRSVLVVGEVGLACVLLVGAGLMLRSFVNLLHTDPGFQPRARADRGDFPSRHDYKDDRQIARFYAALAGPAWIAAGRASRGRGHRPSLDRLRREHGRLHDRRQAARSQRGISCALSRGHAGLFPRRWEFRWSAAASSGTRDIKGAPLCRDHQPGDGAALLAEEDAVGKRVDSSTTSLRSRTG